jgi:uncharacterized protein (UPF0332 family)/predicted nucleotidyltransferase
METAHKPYSRIDARIFDPAYDLSAQLIKKFSLFIKSIVVFGSAIQDKSTVIRDLDVLIVVDDSGMDYVGPLRKYFENEVNKIIVGQKKKFTTKLHVNTVPLSEFWDGVRIGDPITINVLRTGKSVFDRGFFVPLKKLLKKGKIRPSQEAMHMCIDNSEFHLKRAKGFKNSIITELYWAIIDATHSLLMAVKEAPPDPKEAARLLNEKIIKRNLLGKKYASLVERIYKLMKNIESGSLKELPGEKIDKYIRETGEYIQVARKLIQKIKVQGI